MKPATAMRILKKRAAWYGMADDFPRYLDLIHRCGMTLQEEKAVDCLKVHLIEGGA